MTKPTKWHVCPAKTQISLDIHLVCDQTLRCPHEESLGPELSNERTVKTDQTGQQTGYIPRLIGVFAGHTVILLVLS